MPNNSQDAFTFELDESLRLKDGQQVAEMINISLEPEISIQAFDDHVSIRGVIELSGEYYVGEDSQELGDEAAVTDIREFPNKRYMEQVEMREDGVNYFAHQFPVEISIPLYRVSDLKDVTVGIEAFDYELPEASKLRVKATIEINGIVEEQSERKDTIEGDMEADVADEVGEETLETNNMEEQTAEEDTFRFEVEEPPEPPEDQVDRQEYQEEENLSESIQKDQSSDNALSEGEVEDKNRWIHAKTESFASFFGKQSASNEVVIESPESVESIESIESIDPIEDVESPESPESIESIEVNEEPMEQQSEDNERQDDITSFTSLFDTEEEESYTKLRIYIVQESDTIQTIAERYQVSASLLSQTNRLENQDLTAGQMVYIPNKRKKETFR